MSLLLSVLTIFLMRSMLTLFMGHMSLAKWNAMASVISVCLWEVDGYAVALCRLIVMVFWVAVVTLVLALMHSSYCGWWWFFRWLNKLVVLLCGADTTLTHMTWWTSLALNPKNFQTTDDDPFRGTSSSPSAPDISFTVHKTPGTVCSLFCCLSPVLLIPEST